jgi:LmbE family N-acetylglucosaminyl deacetylase
MNSIQIISPHQDDAAFSLGSMLATLAQVPIVLKIINCFTVSDYAPFLKDPRCVTDVRHTEDLEFAQRLGGVVSILDLGYLDAPLRLGVSCELVCGLNPAVDAARGALSASLRDVLTPDPIILPLALGGHVDHVLARNEALSAAGSRPLALYEDLPYADRLTDVELEVGDILRVCKIRAAEFRFPKVAGTSKQFLIRAYSSQASPSTLAHIAGFHDGQESLWMTKEFEEAWQKMDLT